MQPQTFDMLNEALDAVRRDLAPRAQELAERNTRGALSAEEQREYSEIVRLNDALALTKLQARALSATRAAS